jgi:hypothetical protein
MRPHNSVVDEEIEQDERHPCHLECLGHDAKPVFVDWLLGAQTTIDITNLHILGAL